MKSQLTVVMRKPIAQEQADALKEILNSPNFMKIMKAEVAERFETLMDDGSYVESVEFGLLEEEA